MSITPEAMESVLNAIQIIADASKKTDGNGDKTIVCTVVDDSNRHNSQLMVSDGSVKFMASLIQSTDIDKYDVGDQVYVRIVQGDFSNDKIIDGFYVAGDTTVPATFTPPLDTFLGVGDLPMTDGSQTDIIAGLIANGTISEKPIWSWVPRAEDDDLQANGIYDTIGLQASFKTLFGSSKIRQGSYGLRLDLHVRITPTSDKHIVKSVYLDSSEMFGDPYAFQVAAPQSKTFDISQMETIDEMHLYFYQNNDFTYMTPRGESGLPAAPADNLIVSDIYLAFGSELTKVQDNTIKLYCNETLDFKYHNSNDVSNKKNLGFLWYNKDEDNRYIGFSDGIVDLNYPEGENHNNIVTDEDGYITHPDSIVPYDELEYMALSYEDSRLTAQVGKATPDDENGLEISASISEAKTIFNKIMNLFTGDLKNNLTAYKNLLSGIFFDDGNSAKQYIDRKIDELKTFGEEINIHQEALMAWYDAAMAAAAKVQKKEEPITVGDVKKFVKFYKHTNGKWCRERIDDNGNTVYDLQTEDYPFIKGLFMDCVHLLYTITVDDKREYFLDDLRQIIAEHYGGYQSDYDIYNYNINKIFEKLEEYFTQLDSLLDMRDGVEVQSLITSSNDAADNANTSEYHYTMGGNYTTYIERDFTYLNNRYCIYWYRYDKNSEDDGIGGNGWKRIALDDKVFLDKDGNTTFAMPANFGLPTRYTLTEGAVRPIPKCDYGTGMLPVYLTPNQKTEKFKVIIFYNHEKFESNELVFENLDDVEDSATLDAADAIKIAHQTNSYDAYQSLYSQSNALINQNDAIVDRVLKLSYDGLFAGNEALCGAQVFWYIPRHTTMLAANDSNLKNHNGFTSDYYRTGTVIYNNLAIRRGPSTDYEKYDNHKLNDKVNIYHMRGTWGSLQDSEAIGTGGRWSNCASQYVSIADNESSYREGFICYYKTIGTKTIEEQVTDENDEIVTITKNVPEDDDLTFTYRIRDYFIPTSLNNTIYCVVKKDEYEFNAHITMTFGTQGTSGTDFTILVRPAGYQKAVTNSSPLPLEIAAFDYDNNPVRIYNTNPGTNDADRYALYSPSFQWRGPSSYNMAFSAELATNTTNEVNSAQAAMVSNTHPWHCGITSLKVNLMDANYNGIRELQVLYPVPWTADAKYCFEGPTTIVYDSQGNNPSYYKGSCKLFDQNLNTQVEDVAWDIKYYMMANNSDSTTSANAKAPDQMFAKVGSIWNYYPNKDHEGIDKNNLSGTDSNNQKREEINFNIEYAPKLDVNTLTIMPSNIYIDGVYDDDGTRLGDMNVYPVIECRDGNGSLLWAQPILIYQNRYPNSMINNWDGTFKIDEDSGTILSTMVSAGLKNYDNTFSGVMMGKLLIDNKQNIGLYGFHHGAQSFGFNVDGTAFLGKSGSGRILFDGNKGVIQSSAYQNNGTGMLIDLDDGLIDMKSTVDDSKSQVRIQTVTPYFQVRSTAGNVLIHIGSANYYLQSDNYSSTSGMKINLKDGHIDAYNIKITSNNFTLDSSGSGSFKFTTPTITIDSTATGSNPYFRIGTSATTTLIHVSSSDYYLQSSNYNGSTAGTRINLKDGSITSFNFSLLAKTDANNYLNITSTPSIEMKVGGVEVMKINNSAMVFRSPNWGKSGQKAGEFDFNAGMITLRQNAANNDKIVRMNVGAGTYPFQIGPTISEDSSARIFRVSWDGKLVADNAEIKGKITATEGSFTGSIYASGGSITGSLSVTGKLTGNGWEINKDGATFTSLTINGISFETIDSKNWIVVSDPMLARGGLRVPTIEGTYAGDTTRLKITTDVEFEGSVYGLPGGISDSITVRLSNGNAARLNFSNGRLTVLQT